MDIYIALVHHPVLDRRGRTVTTSVTNLDIHDLARCARTYGVRRSFIVTPIEAQRSLASRVVDHWAHGPGRVAQPVRAVAFERVAAASSVDHVVDEIVAASGHRPLLVATGAGFDGDDNLGYRGLRARIEHDVGAALVLFGTGWGLTPELTSRCDLRLPAIRAARAAGPASGDEHPDREGWNHLSVRSALAIILDRLLGER